MPIIFFFEDLFPLDVYEYLVFREDFSFAVYEYLMKESL